jgi:hypothetical protein
MYNTRQVDWKIFPKSSKKRTFGTFSKFSANMHNFLGFFVCIVHSTQYLSYGTEITKNGWVSASQESFFHLGTVTRAKFASGRQIKGMPLGKIIGPAQSATEPLFKSFPKDF